MDESSSVRESHPHALPEPDMNLSTHPAPIDQHESLDQVHATFMPDATQAISRFPLGLSWSQASLQF